MPFGTDRRAVRNAEGIVGHEKHKSSQKERVDMSYNDIYRKASGPQQLRNILFEIRGAEKDGGKDALSPSSSLRAGNLRRNADEIEQRLLDPELKLYCGDVLIEFRPGILKYELLQRLQQDPRLPEELNEVGNIRVVAGSLEFFLNGAGE